MAQAMSRPRPPRRGVWRWVDGLGQSATTMGESADRAGNRVLGVFMLIAILVIAFACIAWLSGLISRETFAELLRTLTGGS